jgi:hypothetical protein
MYVDEGCKTCKKQHVLAGTATLAEELSGYIVRKLCLWYNLASALFHAACCAPPIYFVLHQACLLLLKLQAYFNILQEMYYI